MVKEGGYGVTRVMAQDVHTNNEMDLLGGRGAVFSRRANALEFSEDSREGQSFRCLLRVVFVVFVATTARM